MSVSFSKAILRWYRKNKRDLPWRRTRDPYAIWLSEIILQQTRVEQGLPYYKTFLKVFPDVAGLAGASEREVLKLWQGLGYYSRARNLQAAARQIVSRHGGKFPEQYEDVIRLKGVGPYTAAAIASIAFGQRYAVLDGNVFRVLSRVFAIREDIRTGAARKTFERLANRLLGSNDPGEFNQAVMEFGALHCTPKNPSCNDCCLRAVCRARRLGIVDVLPGKSGPPARRDRYFNYLVIGRNGKYFLTKRGTNDIWKGLYEFPLVESKSKLYNSAGLFRDPGWPREIKKTDVRPITMSESKVHVLSHQRIHARFWKLSAVRSLHVPGWIAVGKKKVQGYPASRLMENYLRSKF